MARSYNQRRLTRKQHDKFIWNKLYVTWETRNQGPKNERNCIYVHTSAPVCVSMCVCLCAWRQLLASSFVAHHFTFLKQDLFGRPGACCVVCTSWSASSPPSPLTSGYRYMRSKLKSSALFINYLIHWAISQALRYHILTNTYLCRNTIDQKGWWAGGTQILLDGPGSLERMVFFSSSVGRVLIQWGLETCFYAGVRGEKDFLAYVNCFISAVAKRLQGISEEGLFSLTVS